MKVKLTDVIDAIDNADDSTAYVYYIPYEEIMICENGHYIGDDLHEDFDETAEEQDFIALPDRHEINDYQNMEKFADQYEDEEVAEWLANSLKGKGAFRRFRAVLERFTIEDEWYDFLELQHKVLAMEWCEEYGIEYKDDTLRFEKQTASAPIKNVTLPSIRVIPVNDSNYMNVVFMAADFHKLLMKSRGLKDKQNEQDAQYNLEDRLDYGDTIIAAGDHGRFVGYAVIQNGDNCLSLTELFVKPDQRRRGIASLLFAEAQKKAQEENSELHVRVPFGNKPMLTLLKKYGYTTLEPLEIRKTVKEDTGASEVTVGDSTLKL